MKVALVPWVREPLIPVIVTAKLPGFAELQEREAVPEPLTLLGLIAPHVRPLGTVSVRVTVPVNPFAAVTVMVDRVDCPTVTPAGEVALIVKSWGALNVKVALDEWVSEPLVPVKLREKVP